MYLGGDPGFPVPCAPWCAVPDPEAPEEAHAAWCCAALDLTVPAQVAKAEWAALVASSVLFRLSGGQFTGICEVEEYLCVRAAPCGCPMLGCGEAWQSLPVPVGGGEWINAGCGCGPGCDCGTRSRIALPWTPVAEVTEVSIDGVVVSTDDYLVVGGQWLYFRSLAPAALTACFDPLSAPVGGLQVKWRHGIAPPPEAITAACVLACELAKACIGTECRLPKRVSSMSRQGVSWTVIDPMDFLEKGLTGLYEVDLFLSTWRGGPGTSVLFPEDVAPIDFSQRARARW